MRRNCLDHMMMLDIIMWRRIRTLAQTFVESRLTDSFYLDPSTFLIHSNLARVAIPTIVMPGHINNVNM